MYKKLIILLLVSFANNIYSQTFLNGDFENHSDTICNYNMSNIDFNNSMLNTYSYSSNAQLDIMTNGCTMDPQSGDWCVGVANWSTSGHDNVNLEFSSHLTKGDIYKISFWTYGNSTYGSVKDTIIFGLSLENNSFGDEVLKFLATEDVWEKHSIQFTADTNYSYMSVKIKEDFHRGWVQIDNFSFETIDTSTTPTPTALNIINTNTFTISPNPANNFLNINLEKSFSNALIKIISTNGKTVYEDNYQNFKELNIDVSILSKGLYLINLQTQNENINTQFIKN